MVGTELRALVAGAPGAGSLDGSGVRHGRGEHPVCGDSVEIDVRLQGDQIAALRWRAAGCPATLAVAAVAAVELERVAVAAAESTLRQGLQRRGDLAAHERHAEAMFVRALRQALAATGS